MSLINFKTSRKPSWKDKDIVNKFSPMKSLFDLHVRWVGNLKQENIRILDLTGSAGFFEYQVMKELPSAQIESIQLRRENAQATPDSYQASFLTQFQSYQSNNEIGGSFQGKFDHAIFHGPFSVHNVSLFFESIADLLKPQGTIALSVALGSNKGTRDGFLAQSKETLASYSQSGMIDAGQASRVFRSLQREALETSGLVEKDELLEGAFNIGFSLMEYQQAYPVETALGVRYFFHQLLLKKSYTDPV